MLVVYQYVLMAALGFALGPVGKMKTHEHLQVRFWHLDTRIRQDED